MLIWLDTNITPKFAAVDFVRLAKNAEVFWALTLYQHFNPFLQQRQNFGVEQKFHRAMGAGVRASPSGFAFGLRLRARPNPRIDSGPMGDARGRSRIPHKTPTAHRGRICRGTPPCGVLERFLPHLLCFTSGLLLLFFINTQDYYCVLIHNHDRSDETLSLY